MVANQILIRPMTEADIQAVARLCGDLDYPTTPEQLARCYVAVRAFPDNEIWVAERHGEVVGWLHGHGGHLLEAESYVEIGGIVVDPACRGLGIGRRLLAACEQWALPWATRASVCAPACSASKRMLFTAILAISRKTPASLLRSTCRDKTERRCYPQAFASRHADPLFHLPCARKGMANLKPRGTVCRIGWGGRRHRPRTAATAPV